MKKRFLHIITNEIVTQVRKGPNDRTLIVKFADGTEQLTYKVLLKAVK